MLLKLVVDERGLPTQIRVIRPIGYGLDERAIEAIKKWNERGNPDLGIRQDKDAALQYYRFCAAAGQILCQYRLGDLLLNQPDAQERDIPQAIAWLELSADQGELQAKMLADRSRTSLTPEQEKQVATLKKQLVRPN